MPTVIIQSAVWKLRVEQMKPPRVLMTRHPMGRPISAPHDVVRQREVVSRALRLLADATAGGAVVELPEPYRPPS
jgi:hypothetical protein